MACGKKAHAIPQQHLSEEADALFLWSLSNGLLVSTELTASENISCKIAEAGEEEIVFYHSDQRGNSSLLQLPLSSHASNVQPNT